MPTLQQLREGIHGAWQTFHEGWERLSRRAAGAMTRFTPGKSVAKDAAGQQRLGSEGRSAGWGLLTAEVFDDDKNIVVRLEAPGMDKDDLDIQVLNDFLVVRGEKHVEHDHVDGRYHVTECAYGSFERAIPLPTQVSMDKSAATYRDGVLRIELPKLVKHARRRIKVDAN